MKTLYLHIGTTKTATTSIQRFLEENKDVLQKYGYCFPDSLHVYPRANKRRNAHFLVAKVWDADGSRNQSKEKEYFEEGLQQIRTAFGTYDHVILTDESIWHALSYSKKSLLQELKKEADEQKYQIKVIVYLRRQDLLIQSYWAQQVKEYMNTCFSDYIVSKKAKYFKLDYDKRLEEMAAAVGRENIIVRVYEKQQYYGGNIISDFLHLFDLEMTDEFKQSDHVVNASLEGACLEAKRLLNANPRFTTKLNFVVPMLTAIQQEKVGEGGYSTGRYFSEEEHQAFLEKYREGNEKVARDYLGREDGVLFKDEIVTEGTGEAETYTTEEMVDILGKVIVLQRDKILQKNEEIAELKKQDTRVKHMIKKAAKWVLRRE